MQHLGTGGMPSSEQFSHALPHPVPHHVAGGQVFRMFPLPPEASNASFRLLLEPICSPTNVSVVEQAHRVELATSDVRGSRSMPSLSSALKASTALTKEAFIHFSTAEAVQPLVRQLIPVNSSGGGGGRGGGGWQINLGGSTFTVEASSWEDMAAAHLHRGMYPCPSKKAGQPGVSNVLLVTMNDYGAFLSSASTTHLELAWAPSIETFHFIFSAVGFVSKILLRRRRSEDDAHCALVQFASDASAVAALEQLNGQPVPLFLLPRALRKSPQFAPAVASCTLRIAFSRHRNLVVHRQSKVCRDYVNPLLPLSSSLLPDIQDNNIPDLPPARPGGTVLLAQIDRMVHRVTLDHLYHVFSNYGAIAKLTLQERAGVAFALVQYFDADKAATAKNTLQGHAIFDGGSCRLIIRDAHQREIHFQGDSETARDYTAKSEEEANSATGQEYVPVRGIDYVHAHEKAAQDYRQGAPRASTTPSGVKQLLNPGSVPINVSHLPQAKASFFGLTHPPDSALSSLPGLGNQMEPLA